MSARFILYIVYCLAVVLISLLILLIPLKGLSVITAPFSFKTFGIRKIKKWHSRTDTLANILIWLSVIGCFVFPFIPYGRWIYAAWLTFTWLCALSRAVRLSGVRSDVKKMTVIFFINCMYGFSLLAGTGVFDGGALWASIANWMAAIESKEALNLVYYLRNAAPAACLIQIAIMLMSTVILWGQFKYMRLENKFHGRNLGLYIIKSIFQIVIIVFLGMFGLDCTESIYNVPEKERMTKQMLPGFDIDELNLDFLKKGEE